MFQACMALVLALTAVLSLAGYWEVREKWQEQTLALGVQSDGIAARLAVNAVNPIWSMDDAAAEDLLKGEMNSQSVSAISLLEKKPDGKEPLFKSVMRDAAWKLVPAKEALPVTELYTHQREIRRGERVIGLARVTMTDRFIKQDMALTTKRMIVRTVAAVAVLVCVMILVLKVSLVRPVIRLVEELLEGSRSLADTSDEISRASQRLASGLVSQSGQKTSIEDAVEILEAVIATGSANRTTTQNAKQLGSTSRQAIEASVAQMVKMNEAMACMAGIIRSIDEIAFQTNILALNAAVEAARAGEAGAGFAVVADEVRNLARRSAEAAKETSGQIEFGRSVSLEVGSLLEKSMARAKDLDEQLTQIAASYSRQDEDNSRIHQALHQIEQVLEIGSEGARETAASSENIGAQAATLHNSIETLRSLVS